MRSAPSSRAQPDSAFPSQASFPESKCSVSWIKVDFTYWSSLINNCSLYQWTPHSSEWESARPQYLLHGSQLVSAPPKHLGLNLSFTGSSPWRPRCVQEYFWTLKKLGFTWGTFLVFTWLQSAVTSLKQRRCAQAEVCTYWSCSKKCARTEIYNQILKNVLKAKLPRY